MTAAPRALARSLSVLLLPVLATVPASAGDLSEALAASKASIALRYRFETVDDDGFRLKAEASTLRTTLGVKTGAYKGFTLFLEAENVAAVFDDERYNNAGAGALSNLVRDRPVIADPEMTEINQALLLYQNDKLELGLGRQELAWGDERFLGPVGWRQNHQSFDALRAKLSFNPKVSAEYALITRVHRVFGDDKDLEGHFLIVPVALGGGRAKFTPYGLLLDYDAVADAALSTFTWGAELRGGRDLSGGARLQYEAELASQQDAGNNPRHVDASYFFLAAGYGKKALSGRIAFESLSGSPEDGAFATPLATLHRWNGWADKFLATPQNGLEDFFVELEGESGNIKWLMAYHDFAAESRPLDYGTEIDAQITYKTSWKQTLALKLASYDAEDFGRDTDKWFFWTTWQF